LLEDLKKMELPKDVWEWQLFKFMGILMVEVVVVVAIIIRVLLLLVVVGGWRWEGWKCGA
jgi:hypothetical protein